MQLAIRRRIKGKSTVASRCHQRDELVLTEQYRRRSTRRHRLDSGSVAMKERDPAMTGVAAGRGKRLVCDRVELLASVPIPRHQPESCASTAPATVEEGKGGGAVNITVHLVPPRRRSGLQGKEMRESFRFEDLERLISVLGTWMRLQSARGEGGLKSAASAKPSTDLPKWSHQ